MLLTRPTKTVSFKLKLRKSKTILKEKKKSHFNNFRSIRGLANNDRANKLQKLPGSFESMKTKLKIPEEESML
jgi:hypothetical protein